MRPYNSEIDYPIVLEAARVHGTSLTAVAYALEAAGVRWPKLQDNGGRQTAEQKAMDDEIGRAWRELGLCK